MTVGIDNSCLPPGTYSISAVKYAALCRQFTGIKEKEEKKRALVKVRLTLLTYVIDLPRDVSKQAGKYNYKYLE